MGMGKVKPTGECCGTCRSFSKGTMDGFKRSGGWCMARRISTHSGGVCPKWKACVRHEGRYVEIARPVSVFHSSPWD